MGKPTICICENKDADQLRGNREADQRLCFRYKDSTIPLLSRSKISKSLAIFCACTARFVSDLFGNHIVGFPTRRLICYMYQPVCFYLIFFLEHVGLHHINFHVSIYHVIPYGQRIFLQYNRTRISKLSQTHGLGLFIYLFIYLFI